MNEIPNKLIEHYSLKQWLLDQIEFHGRSEFGANIFCVPYFKKCLALCVKSGKNKSRGIAPKRLPEAFKTEGNDITKELKFKLDPTGNDSYWIDINHEGRAVGYINYAGFKITERDYAVIKCTNAFKIIRKQKSGKK